MNTDPCAFDPGVSTADAFGFDDVAIIGRRFHLAKHITSCVKIDIVPVSAALSIRASTKKKWTTSSAASQKSQRSSAALAVGINDETDTTMAAENAA